MRHQNFFVFVCKNSEPFNHFHRHFTVDNMYILFLQTESGFYVKYTFTMFTLFIRMKEFQALC